MARIDQELLRKRAEHNEKMLSNLEEISLHQNEIIKIENLDVYCRHLKILLLQNNIIDKIENVTKLKELEYLNLALNNIAIIENLEGCESLQKLDLTVNFIELENLQKSAQCLSKCKFLKELYMTGNPCTDWAGCRDYLIAYAPQLQMFDGKEILPSERIKAQQKLPELENELIYAIEEYKIKKEQQEHEEQLKQGDDDKQAYTRESRRKMYLDMAKEKEEEDKRKNPEKYEPKKEPTPMFLSNGAVRQCDEGGYKPLLNEWDEAEYSIFKMKIPKYLDTSLIEFQLYPMYVSVRVKGKLTQLRFHEEIVVEKSTVERSQVTGELVVRMPKLKPDYTLKKIVHRKDLEQKKIEKEKERQQKEKERKEKEERELLIQKIEGKVSKQKQQQVEDVEDDDDIPDLE